MPATLALHLLSLLSHPNKLPPVLSSNGQNSNPFTHNILRFVDRPQIRNRSPPSTTTFRRRPSHAVAACSDLPSHISFAIIPFPQEDSSRYQSHSLVTIMSSQRDPSLQAHEAKLRDVKPDTGQMPLILEVPSLELLTLSRGIAHRDCSAGT